MRPGVRTLPLIVLCLFVEHSSGAQSAGKSYYAAIRANDLPRLEAAVTAGGVEVVDEQGRTPLMHAAAIGSLEAVRLLIEKGAKVNAADSFGVTPLMFGARDLAKVRLLLEKGADPNAKSQQGQPALLIAAAKPGSIDTVRLLVEKGADPKAVGAAGRTGLTVAAMASDLAMAQFFVDRGVDVNAAFRSDKENNTALMVASTQHNAPIARLLLQKGAEVDAVTKQNGKGRNGSPGNGGVSALGMAVPYGSPELIRTLLDARANPNTRDNRGMTPLMLAVASENQDPEVVKLLLAAGADPTIKSDVGETALDWARKYGHPATLALLGGGSGPPPAATPVAPGTVSLPAADALRTMIQESTALLQRSSKQFAVARRVCRLSSPAADEHGDRRGPVQGDSRRRDGVVGLVAVDGGRLSGPPEQQRDSASGWRWSFWQHPVHPGRAPGGEISGRRGGHRCGRGVSARAAVPRRPLAT